MGLPACMYLTISFQCHVRCSALGIKSHSDQLVDAHTLAIRFATAREKYSRFCYAPGYFAGRLRLECCPTLTYLSCFSMKFQGPHLAQLITGFPEALNSCFDCTDMSAGDLAPSLTRA